MLRVHSISSFFENELPVIFLSTLIDFVVNRLAKIPESKKAVMVFPTYEDYEAVTNSPWNDYLPCITSLQFRVTKRQNKACLDLALFMRSLDGFQKGAGDVIVVSMIADIIRRQLEEKPGIEIAPGRLDGLVTDVHIYENTYEKAQQVVFDYLHERAPEVARVHALM